MSKKEVAHHTRQLGAQLHSSRYVRTNVASEYCGLAKSTLEKLRVTGAGPPFIKPGRTVLYDILDLDAWLATKRRQSTSDTGEAQPAAA